MIAQALPPTAATPGRSLVAAYFGTTVGFPPGEPGGGMTGVRPAAPVVGPTVIPGSTFGGEIVPCCLDN